MVATEIIRFAFTSDYKYITSTYSNQTFFLGNISFSMALMIAFGIAIAFTVAMFFFLIKTTSGAPSGRPPRTRTRRPSWA